MKTVKRHPVLEGADIYFASVKEQGGQSLYVEARMFFDARAVACALLGVPEVDIARMPVVPRKPLPRWQVRWIGNTSSDKPLQKTVRRIERESDDLPWVDLREASARG